MKTTFSKEKFDSQIIDHFDNFGKYEYMEDCKKELEIEFSEIIHGITYDFGTIYNPDNKKVYGGVDCYHGNDEVELTLNPCNYNPNKESLYEALQSIIAKQELVDEENKKSSEAIEAHNDYLDLNDR